MPSSQSDRIRSAVDHPDVERAAQLVATKSSDHVAALHKEHAATEAALVAQHAATLSAASLVGTGTSAAATTQVLSTVSTLSANPEALSEDSQTGALDLLDNVVGGSAETGIDPDAAASTAAAVSSLLDASLFSAPAEGESEDAAASKAALGGQMAGTVGALATGMVANAFGGQSFPLSTPNLELSASRTDCGTRDVFGGGFGLGAGKGGVTGMPSSAMDAAGGGSCDEVQRRRGRARRQ